MPTPGWAAFNIGRAGYLTPPVGRPTSVVFLDPGPPVTTNNQLTSEITRFMRVT